MPPPSRAIRTPQIFPRIFCAFLRDSGNTHFSSAKTSKNNLRKIFAKMGAKICAPKICAKDSLNVPFVGKMEASKKHKKNLRQTCAKPQPQRVAKSVDLVQNQARPKDQPFAVVAALLVKSMRSCPHNQGHGRPRLTRHRSLYQFRAAPLAGFQEGFLFQCMSVQSGKEVPNRSEEKVPNF